MPEVNGSNHSEGVSDLESNFISISMTPQVVGTFRGRRPTVTDTGSGRELPRSPADIAEGRRQYFVSSFCRSIAIKQR